jgi:hypothetical protein
MNPRKNHYIPRMLLKRFCAPDGLLWVNNGDKIYRSSPRDAFEERDLNATHNVVPSAAGDRYSVNLSYEHEDALSKIEGNAEPAIQRIIEQARKLSPPRLSPKMQNAWKYFYIAMARRTPEAQEEIWPEAAPQDAFYKGAQMDAEKAGFLLPDKEDFFLCDDIAELAKHAERNSKARFSAGSHPILQEDGEQFARSIGLLVAVISFSEKNFVIGSRGLAIVEDNDPDDKLRGSWLPVAPNVAICATSFPDSEYLVRIGNGRDRSRKINAINNASAARSWAIAGQSEELVRSVKPAGEKSPLH